MLVKWLQVAWLLGYSDLEVSYREQGDNWIGWYGCTDMNHRGYCIIEGYKRTPNTKLLTYDIRLRREVSDSIRGMGYQDLLSLGCVVSNLIACIRKGNVLVYSRRITTKLSSKKGITVKKIISAVNHLEKEGYVINTIGKGHINKDERMPSTLQPTQKFIDEFGGCIVDVVTDDYLKGYTVLELRDENKNPISFRNNKETTEMHELVMHLNERNEQSVVRDKNGLILTNIYCRVFNELWTQGGRYYRGDVLSIKNRGTDDRLRITIDGGSVCEVDYSNLHFRIVAAQFKTMPEENIPQDVYSDVLEDSDNLVDRGIIKETINIMFNCGSRKQAISAVNSSLNRMTDEEKAARNLHKAKDIISVIENAYPEFKDFFCRDGGFGGSLQNLDSRLASNVIETMLQHDCVILPVHDSFVILQENIDLLIRTMADEFRQTFGWGGAVPLGIKYIDERGVLIDEKIVA